MVPLPLLLLAAAHHCAALTIAGLEVPHAQLSPTSRALDRYEWPEKFPYSKQDLTPDWAGNDQYKPRSNLCNLPYNSPRSAPCSAPCSAPWDVLQQDVLHATQAQPPRGRRVPCLAHALLRVRATTVGRGRRARPVQLIHLALPGGLARTAWLGSGLGSGLSQRLPNS